VIQIIAVCVAVVVALGGISWGVGKIKDVGRMEAEAKCAAAAKAQQEKEQAASAKAAAALSAERKKRKVVKEERIVYVDKIVEREVYARNCFDSSGVSCVNSAIKGESAAGCKLDRGMPGVKPPR
jgi:hypothetical protein